MMSTTISYKFVDAIPERLEEQTLYISMDYATVVHKCCCRCGKEVVTPLSPTDWKLIYDGSSVSLDPSIGNWSFDCKSHYWINRNKVRWAASWTDSQITEGRLRNRGLKNQHYSNNTSGIKRRETPDRSTTHSNFFSRIKRWFGR